MTGEELNGGYVMTEEMQQTLARMKERMDAEDAERKRQEQRNTTYAELKKREEYAVLKQGGIDEMIQKKPEILDNPTALEMAIESTVAKLKLQEAEAKAKAAPETSAQNPFNPANPTGSNAPADDKTPLTSQQFMDKMVAGQATLEDLERVPKGHLNPFVRYQAKKAIVNRRGNIEETIAKGQAALGVER